jgi:hypothetical protein
MNAQPEHFEAIRQFILVAVASGALEETGSIGAKSLFNLISTFISLLRRKDPDTATAIEEFAQNSQLREQHLQSDYLNTLINQVASASKNDLELQDLLQKIAIDIKEHPSIVINSGKLAEKIGVNIQGGYNPIKLEF